MTMMANTDIKSTILKKMANYQMPGISMRLVHKNKVVYELDLGVGDIVKQTPIDKNSIFGIGCSTKPIAALALLMLFEEKNISLSEPVHRFIPSLKHKYQNLQVGHLINHSGGIWRGNKSKKNQTNEETLTKIECANLLYPSSEKFKYSNWGYFLIGCIVEKLSGMTRTEYVSKKIFTSLGMNHSSFRDDHKILPKNLINGYWNEWYFGGADYRLKIKKSPVFSLNSYAGGILTTTDDYAKLLLELGNPESKIISNRIKELMFTPSLKVSSVKYSGMGFLIEKTPEYNLIYFPGSNSGFASFSVIFQKPEVSGVIFANRSACNTELRKYIDIALAETFPDLNLKIINTPYNDAEGEYYGRHNKKIEIRDCHLEYPRLILEDREVTLYHQNHRRFYMIDGPYKNSMLRVYRRKGVVKRISVGPDFYYSKLPMRIERDTILPNWKRFTGMFYCEFFDKAEILQRDGKLFINWGAIYETVLTHLENGLFIQKRGPFHLEQLKFNVADNWKDDNFTISELIFKRIT